VGTSTTPGVTRQFSGTLAWIAVLLCAPWSSDASPVDSSGKSRSGARNSRFIVVSDVDDTIKDTGVTVGKTHILNLPRLALDPIRPWKPVPGMPQLYHQLRKELGAKFYYVSKGPAFSRGRLQDAIDRYHFPEGEIRLNAHFPATPPDYKFRVISPIVCASPGRQFILIGDSGEQDPESYGELARAFPHQIAHVYIRSVTKDWEGRYRRAFRHVPHSKWEVFAVPSDLRRGA